MIIGKINHARRLFATATAFTLFGIGGVIIPWVAYPIIRFSPISPARKQRWARKLINAVFSTFVWFMKVTGILSWKIINPEKLQRPGLLLLANHPTLIDVVFLVSFLPNADCIVKGALLKNPSMRGFLKLTGFITNDTGPELLEQADKSLKEGSVLVIFPEGTRTKPGAGMNFQRGAANLALRTKTDVTPVTITCNPLGLSKEHKWYDGARAKMHFEFKVGDDIPISPYDDMHASKAARQFTRDLERHFEEDLKYERA